MQHGFPTLLICLIETQRLLQTPRLQWVTYRQQAIFTYDLSPQFHSLFHYLPISVAEPSKMSDRVSTVVKVLRYKSEGRWFDSKWFHWYVSLT